MELSDSIISFVASYNSVPILLMVLSCPNSRQTHLSLRLFILEWSSWVMNSQRKDPKKELLNLLVKLSENKTISGVTDVVEEFITDASNNLVDRNRLFGQPGETAAQGLKKKVSNTVVKCLTDQINEQFDQINGLEKERELYLKKIRSMESQLQASLGPGGNNPAASAPAAVAAEAASVDILTGSTDGRGAEGARGALVHVHVEHDLRRLREAYSQEDRDPG